MFRGHWIGVLATALVLVGVIATGCSKNSTSPTNTQNENLNDPTGGFNSQNEQAAFGDQSLANSASAEVAMQDPMLTDPSISAWISNPQSANLYAVSLLWGILRKDPTVSSAGDGTTGLVTDWTGYAEVNDGAIVGRSTIAFESNDQWVQPRADIRRIDWISHTSDRFDGVRFTVVQPIGNGDDGSTDSLTVVAGTHTWRFHVNDLASMDTTYVVDQEGNKFAIKSFAVVPGSCDRGFISGSWLPPMTSGEKGVIRGRWIDKNGDLVGYVRGFLGTNQTGRNVFFAKYIDLNGAFKGIVVGTWGEIGVDTGTGDAMGNVGWFHGTVLDAARSPSGSVDGRWRTRTNGLDGVFDGTWSIGCTE